MTAHDFIRGLVAHLEKIIIDSRLGPGWMIGCSTSSKVYYPEFIVEDKEIILETTKILAALGSLTYPAIWIYKTLAYELGWFEHDPDEQDPQFAVKLGPNLCIESNGHEIPRTSDIKSNFSADGQAQNVTFRQILNYFPMGQRKFDALYSFQFGCELVIYKFGLCL